MVELGGKGGDGNGALRATATLTTKLFPSDHGLILLSRFQSLPLACLSCHKDGVMFGLRASPSAGRPFLEPKAAKQPPRGGGEPSTASAFVAHFVADFPDGARGDPRGSRIGGGGGWFAHRGW